MNNIFLGANDPLLYNNTNPYNQTVQDKIDPQRYDYAMRMRQMPDKLSELDQKLKNLNQSVLQELENDFEFKDLSSTLQSAVQAEIMNLVRHQINCNQEAVKNIERQLLIIKSVEAKTSAQEKKNMAELNEYLQNYSNITFDEFKKLKAENHESR